MKLQVRPNNKKWVFIETTMDLSEYVDQSIILELHSIANVIAGTNTIEFTNTYLVPTKWWDNHKKEILYTHRIKIA